jgi:hypothetical protein
VAAYLAWPQFKAFVRENREKAENQRRAENREREIMLRRI